MVSCQFHLFCPKHLLGLLLCLEDVEAVLPMQYLEGLIYLQCCLVHNAKLLSGKFEKFILHKLRVNELVGEEE